MSGTIVIDKPTQQVVPVSDIEKNVNTSFDFDHSLQMLTSTDVKCIVNRALNNTAEVIAYSLEPYSDKKVGFLASHHCLNVTVRTKDSEFFKTMYFFVKAIPYDVTTQADYIRERGVFVQEAMFFDEIAPKLYDCELLGDAWSPRSYFIKDDVLVFEELRVKGFSTREKFFNEELIVAGLAAIARFHAASLAAEARLGKPLGELYAHALKERTFCHMGCQTRAYKAGIDVIIAVTEQLGLDASMIPAACECIFDAIEPSRSTCNVICHGDLWANNLMFDSSVPPRCLLVDFQLIRYCSPANDVVQFLHLTTTRKFRETRGNAMIKHYYFVLCETLRATNAQLEPFSWTDMMRSAEEQRLGAVIAAAMFMPITLMDEALCSKIMNNPVSYDNYIYNNRRDTVLLNMKYDTEYATRIKEIVMELQELSLQLKNLPKPS